MEEAAVVLTGLEVDRIMQALAVVERQSRNSDRSLSIVHDYLAPNVSEKVLRTILSYTGYANRVVWSK
jgi:UDP-N-acetylglucosamine 2-epimerase (non-hydrolysing)